MAKRLGSRWLWHPHINAYYGLPDVPQPCTIISRTSYTMPATKRLSQIGPYHYIVRLDDGGKVYAFDAGLHPIPEPVSALSVLRSPTGENNG